jgi:hypothetical protein
MCWSQWFLQYVDFELVSIDGVNTLKAVACVKRLVAVWTETACGTFALVTDEVLEMDRYDNNSFDIASYLLKHAYREYYLPGVTLHAQMAA